MRSYLDEVSNILCAKEIPHKTIVGTLDDVAGIMSSAQQLGIQVICVDYSCANEHMGRCRTHVCM